MQNDSQLCIGDWARFKSHPFFYTYLSLRQRSGHPLNTAAFIINPRVNVKVKCGRNGRVPQNHRHGLVVALALDAAGGEAVAQGVEAHRGDSQMVKDAQEIVPVVAGLQRSGGIGHHEIIRVHNPQECPDGCGQGLGDGDVADRRNGLGRADGEIILLLPAVGKIDAGKGFAHVKDAGGHIQVFPLQGADFADAKAGVEADQDAQIPEGEVGFEVRCQALLLGQREDGKGFLLRCGCGVMNASLHVGPEASPFCETEDHPEDQEGVLDGFRGEPFGQEPVHEGLDFIRVDGKMPSEGREEVCVEVLDVGGVGRFLDVLAFFCFPLGGELLECDGGHDACVFGSMAKLQRGSEMNPRD